MKKKVHKKHHEQHVEVVTPLEAVEGLERPRSRVRIAGNAFLVMGVILVSLPFAFFFLGLNSSVADWVGSLFFHFIPGIILLVSAWKLLRG